MRNNYFTPRDTPRIFPFTKGDNRQFAFVTGENTPLLQDEGDILSGGALSLLTGGRPVLYAV